MFCVIIIFICCREAGSKIQEGREQKFWRLQKSGSFVYATTNLQTYQNLDSYRSFADNKIYKQKTYYCNM